MGAHLVAPASHSVTHRQFLRAAVGEVLTARGLWQRAARPREAVPKEIAQATARASYNQTHIS